MEANKEHLDLIKFPRTYHVFDTGGKHPINISFKAIFDFSIFARFFFVALCWQTRAKEKSSIIFLLLSMNFRRW